MDVFWLIYHKKPIKSEKPLNRLFWKLSVFLSDIKADVIFEISGIENPGVDCFDANRTFFRELLRKNRSKFRIKFRNRGKFINFEKELRISVILGSF